VSRARKVLSRLDDFRALEAFARTLPESKKLQPLEVLDLAVNAFRAAGVDYAIVGGLALAVLATPRYTMDVDAAVPHGQLAAAEKALLGAGFTKAEEYEFGKKVKTHVHKFKHAAGEELDLIDFPGEKGLQDLVSTPASEHEGKNFTSIDSLIIMKLLAFRPKDKADLVSLAKEPYDPQVVSHWARALGIFDRVPYLDQHDEGECP
jgi:hypothetical protein